MSCQTVHEANWLRVSVGPGLAAEVQECYRQAAMECLRTGCDRVLVLGTAKVDPAAHLAGRDALRSLAVAGLPAGFRLALVALTANLASIYDDAVLEAQRLGFEARRFAAQAEAELWLSA